MARLRHISEFLRSGRIVGPAENVGPRKFGATDFCPDGFTYASADDLATMPYADYLCTEHWQQRRRGVLRYKRHCERCMAPATEVHHLTYERRGQEKAADLMALCADCHRKIHGIEDR